ncbi:hypothetical protein DERF_000026 [Dermatophagoides farinae]|uniref:Uncharacterized protein n=1 Tax=Dermatophagoides farinae TaxID=6954 RepID=A0A922L890_DERFA|nr:hypothetical protein DERF_000026 [Dermatophagoides farinae]
MFAMVLAVLNHQQSATIFQLSKMCYFYCNNNIFNAKFVVDKQAISVDFDSARSNTAVTTVSMAKSATINAAIMNTTITTFTPSKFSICYGQYGSHNEKQYDSDVHDWIFHQQQQQQQQQWPHRPDK